jgi:hypothetical protein
METYMNDNLQLTQGQLAVFNDVHRRAFYLAEILAVLPDYEYKIRFQIETQTGYELHEQIVRQRYLAKLSRFMEAMGVSRR